MSATQYADAGAASGHDYKIPERIERLPMSSWQVKARVIVGVATFFDAFDSLAIASILPVIIPLWKIAPSKIGALIAIGFAGQLIGAIFFGWLAERFGRMPAMVWSIALFAIMSLACAQAWSYDSLFWFRFVQGIGLGGEVPIAAAYISEMTKAKGRGRFVLLYELIFPVGIVAAAFLGRWLVPQYGWQVMFYVGALPALLALVLRIVLPESPRWLASRGRMQEADAAMRVIELGVEKSTGMPLPPPAIAVQAPVKKASLSDLFGTTYLRRTLVLWTIWFCAYYINYGLTVWLPSLYTGVLKVPLAQALSYSLYGSMIGFLGSLACALLIDVVGRRVWITVCFFLGTLVLATLWFNGVKSAQFLFMMASLLQLTTSSVCLAVYVYTPENYPTRARAIAVSTSTAWLRLASIIGPIAVGSLIPKFGLNSIFLMFAIVAFIGFVVVGLFAEETKNRVLEEVSP